MKQKLGIVLFLIVIVGVLAALSAATYVRKEKAPDSESTANRSTYNAGSTGTQAYFALLSETGRKAMRWQMPPAALLTAKPADRPSVFVVIGYTRRTFKKDEVAPLLEWVSSGGRLVLINREAEKELLQTSSAWTLATDAPEDPDLFSVDPADDAAMILNTPVVKPVQPSIFTAGVNAVQTSRFAGSVTFNRGSAADDEAVAVAGTREVPTPADYSPAVHLASGERNILVDAPYGDGRIVVLSDPYVVSNGGIDLVDNAKLAVNLVSVAGAGVVAFDEYHQGYGTDSNRFLDFFAGTPIVPLFIQGVLIVGFAFYSQSRRFGRPIPVPEEDRLSKLEYVAAMAELQRRTKAYDLALENIYTEFRRRVSRAYGLDAMKAGSQEMALAIVGSPGAKAAKIEATLFNCEEIIRGRPSNKREVLKLTTELRAIDARLGRRRGGRI